MENAAEQSQVVIKRYPNRKLYDTKSSSYITLSGIVAMLRTGTDVRVVNSKNGDDITGQILASALLDRRELYMDPSSVLALKQVLKNTNGLGTYIREGI